MWAFCLEVGETNYFTHLAPFTPVRLGLPRERPLGELQLIGKPIGSEQAVEGLCVNPTNQQRDEHR